MDSPAAIETDPLLFDKLLAPLQHVLERLDQQPVSQAASKLRFALFVRVLLFRLFAQIRSLRDLVIDLKSCPTARALGLLPLGLSTLHDAFARYPVAWLASLTTHLLLTLPLAQIPEVAELGKLWCVDSSWWPVIYQVAWLKERGVAGVRLHLGLSLNQLCPTTFLLSYDKSPTTSDRHSLRQMIEAGVTYIVDRGYIDLKLYLEVMAREAFFVVRERNNLRYRVVATITVPLDAALGAVVQGVSDSVVKLERDHRGTLFRLVCFSVCGHQYKLLTNRWDLTTHQVLMIYCWRWQVELIFRAWKHTLGALHLINLSEAGIMMQFQILVIGSLLWVASQQEALQAVAVERAARRKKSAQERLPPLTQRLSQALQVGWRWLRPVMRVVRNCLAQPVSCYSKHVAALRL